MTDTLERPPDRRILDAADDLFGRHGVTAVRMADVRDTAEVSMRRLYNTVGDKPELVTRWLADRDRRWLTRFETLVDEHITEGADPIDAVFDTLGALLEGGGFRGCSFLRTLAELADLPEPTRAAIVDHKAAFAHSLDLRLGLGDALVLLVDGAVTHAALHRSIAPLESARRLAHQLHTSRETTP